MKTIIVFTLAAVLSGCAALHDPGEDTFIALRAIDTAQTYKALNDPCRCFYERGSFGLLPRRPSSAETLGYAAAETSLHVSITELLLHYNHPWLARAWEALGIADEGRAVVLNWHLISSHGDDTPSTLTFGRKP